MIKLILFGSPPPNHHTGTVITAEGKFLSTCLFGIQMILAGLLLPFSNLLKTPICLNVKPSKEEP